MENTNVFAITVSPEQSEKLYTAYLGLPSNRQTIIDEQVVILTKANPKISKNDARKMATFNEIFQPKLDHYFEKGEENRKQIAEKTAAMLTMLSAEEKQALLASLGVVQE